MKKFIWLNGSCVTPEGKRLKHSKEHDAEDFAPEVVKEWIKTGAAEMIGGKSEKSKSEVK